MLRNNQPDRVSLSVNELADIKTAARLAGQDSGNKNSNPVYPPYPPNAPIIIGGLGGAAQAPAAPPPQPQILGLGNGQSHMI